MSGVLVVAEYAEGRLADSAHNLVTAALALREPVSLGVVSRNIDQLSVQGAISGVDDILVVRTDSERFDPEIQSAAVRQMIEQLRPLAIVMAFTIRAASFAAGLAESLNLGFASDVVGLSRGDAGELLAVRPAYGGKVHAELAFSAESPTMALLRPDVWQGAEAGGAPRLRELSFQSSVTSRIRHREYLRPEAGVDLTRADVIFALGRGVGEQKNIELFAEIAKQMNVALGASRPLVDAGWMPAPHQVGQTGVTVKPRLYVAFGISGALQHLSGMQLSKTIVAINSDKDAAIFDFADFGAVADIHEVAKEMRAKLGS